MITRQTEANEMLKLILDRESMTNAKHIELVFDDGKNIVKETIDSKPNGEIELSLLGFGEPRKDAVSSTAAPQTEKECVVGFSKSHRPTFAAVDFRGLLKECHPDGLPWCSRPCSAETHILQHELVETETMENPARNHTDNSTFSKEFKTLQIIFKKFRLRIDRIGDATLAQVMKCCLLFVIINAYILCFPTLTGRRSRSGGPQGQEQ
jgi:hypothetical protein